MNRNGFTLVELLAVISVLGLVLIITATNGFGIFEKAKGGINQIEENNLIEATKVFLVDIDNKFVNTMPENDFDVNKVNVVCDGASCYYITIGSDNTITKTDCTDFFCGTVVDVKYLKDNKYFNDSKDKCDNNAKLNIRIEGELEYTDYKVTKVGEDALCKKNDSAGLNVDYKLINSIEDYLEELVNIKSSTIFNYYTEKEVNVSDIILESGFIPDSGYVCSGKIKMQILGEFKANDYVALKPNDDVICSN